MSRELELLVAWTLRVNVASTHMTSSTIDATRVATGEFGDSSAPVKLVGATRAGLGARRRTTANHGQSSVLDSAQRCQSGEARRRQAESTWWHGGPVGVACKGTTKSATNLVGLPTGRPTHAKSVPRASTDGAEASNGGRDVPDDQTGHALKRCEWSRQHGELMTGRSLSGRLSVPESLGACPSCGVEHLSTYAGRRSSLREPLYA